eukprot:GHVU01106803.1.p1 GENE.GHVU01106803.1~~GHVU01106803.1.p1  ORF type:complete len:154 (-),score=12.07 GHVU01106803.1:247-708(-)
MLENAAKRALSPEETGVTQCIFANVTAGRQCCLINSVRRVLLFSLNRASGSLAMVWRETAHGGKHQRVRGRVLKQANIHTCYWETDRITNAKVMKSNKLEEPDGTQRPDCFTIFIRQYAWGNSTGDCTETSLPQNTGNGGRKLNEATTRSVTR